MSEKGKFILEVPLDASGVKNLKPDRAVKVVAYNRSGAAASSTLAKLDAKGQGQATLAFEENPGGVRVLVGPENASEEDLSHLQTLSVSVSPAQWTSGNSIRVSPVVISPYYWDWWLWWCREYTITGRVVCADGSTPVPGATVCAYDVDWLWWWFSEDKVGCAVTDVSGAFQITFRRCCGWFPWWWWRLREWRLEPDLAGRIATLLRQDPAIRRLPLPSPEPDLSIFGQLLAQSVSGAPPNIAAARAANAPQLTIGSKIDPTELEGLRTQLVQRLPAAPEFEPIRLWPWWPWWPWLNCDANIIFKATQNCAGQNVTIIDETIWNVRPDIPTNLNVSLVSNDQACCLISPCTDPDQCPEGDCILLSGICNDSVNTIGGNVGAPASPVGLLYPGAVPPASYVNYCVSGAFASADRPYSGTVPIQGSVGTGVDYYEFLYSTTGFGGPWLPLPTAAVGGFDRQVFVGPSSWPLVPFYPTPISDGSTTHLVFETVDHYVANNGPQLWGANCYFTLMGLVTDVLPNGTYYLQATGWTRAGYAGNLTAPKVLPLCDTDNPNGIVLTTDNQTTNTAGPTDFYGEPCGAGTVHLCTVQPETAILQVAIIQSGIPVILGPCGSICIGPTDVLQIDFAAYDPDAYLAYYTLNVTYGASLINDLLCISGATLSASPIPAPWAPPTSQVGPDYGSALTQGAVSPKWNGGSIRLTVSAVLAFPETCAYELQLYALKRTVGCYIGSTAAPPTTTCGDDHSFWNQYNLSEQSFTVIVPIPPDTCPPTITNPS